MSKRFNLGFINTEQNPLNVWQNASWLAETKIELLSLITKIVWCIFHLTWVWIWLANSLHNHIPRYKSAHLCNHMISCVCLLSLLKVSLFFIRHTTKWKQCTNDLFWPHLFMSQKTGIWTRGCVDFLYPLYDYMAITRKVNIWGFIVIQHGSSLSTPLHLICWRWFKAQVVVGGLGICQQCLWQHNRIFSPPCTVLFKTKALKNCNASYC